MSRILIAYATSEGQTAKITGALADQFATYGHTVQLATLDEQSIWPDPAIHDAVIVAASVHAGQHQQSALRFVQQHRAVLADRVTAFLSVSMSASATKASGIRQATEQAEAFLRKANWRPVQVETVAGALRFSQLSWLWRWLSRILQHVFKKELHRLGWPEDLTRDEEFTDWEALHRFGERFAARL